MNASPSPKILDLDFVYIELHEDYLVSSIKEGVVFDQPHLNRFYAIFDTYYPGKKFGYISDRQHDYTVNPTCYLESSKYPNLLGMAVLCHSESNYRTAMFEKAFYKRPFEAFYTMEDSKSWVLELVSQQSGSN